MIYQRVEGVKTKWDSMFMAIICGYFPVPECITGGEILGNWENICTME